MGELTEVEGLRVILSGWIEGDYENWHKQRLLYELWRESAELAAAEVHFIPVEVEVSEHSVRDGGLYWRLRVSLDVYGLSREDAALEGERLIISALQRTEDASRSQR